MSIQQLDIWNNWHRGMTLAFRDGNPVTDGYIAIRADEQSGCGCSDNCGCGCSCGGHDHGDNCRCGRHDHGNDCGCAHEENLTVLRDALINMLYFAAFRAHCGVRVSGLGEDFEMGADELTALGAEIEFLSNVFGYKTGQIGLEQFAREISGQTVYYSTLAGENGDGGTAFFACTSGDGVDCYPVFLTEPHLREFFDAYNRSGYMIMHSRFAEFLSMLDLNEQLQKLGAVVEPMLNCAIGFPSGFRIH